MQNRLHKAAIKIRLFICVSYGCVTKLPSWIVLQFNVYVTGLTFETFEALSQPHCKTMKLRYSFAGSGSTT